MDANPSLKFNLDTAVYRLTAIKKAAYKFSGRCVVQIRLVDQQTAEVQLEASAASVDLQNVRRDFLREVTDQELREVVLEETAGVRNLLLAQAFSSTSLIPDDEGVDDYQLDPQRISRPDAEAT